MGAVLLSERHDLSRKRDAPRCGDSKRIQREEIENDFDRKKLPFSFSLA